MRVVPMAAILLAGMLSGCAVPPIMLAASVLGDGTLAVTTGKDSTEHLVSAVTGKDCVTGRMLKGENMCRDENKPSEATATAAAPAPTEVQTPPVVVTEAKTESVVATAPQGEVKAAHGAKRHHHHKHKHLAHRHKSKEKDNGPSAVLAPARS